MSYRLLENKADNPPDYTCPVQYAVPGEEMRLNKAKMR